MPITYKSLFSLSGPKRLERMMGDLVGLRDAGAVKGKIVVCDATFIQAYSKRDPKDDSKGYRLGYKLHSAVDATQTFH
jgi:hypothetical protein